MAEACWARARNRSRRAGKCRSETAQCCRLSATAARSARRRRQQIATQWYVKSACHCLFVLVWNIINWLLVVCRNKEVRKEYLALTVGVPREECFTVDAPIDRDDREK